MLYIRRSRISHAGINFLCFWKVVKLRIGEKLEQNYKWRENSTTCDNFSITLSAVVLRESGKFHRLNLCSVHEMNCSATANYQTSTFTYLFICILSNTIESADLRQLQKGFYPTYFKDSERELTNPLSLYIM